MSTHAKQPSDSDLWNEDEPTVVELRPEDYDTPVEPPLCVECGSIVFTDDFDLPSLMGGFPSDRCIRARDEHFHWCHRLEKAVFFPRKKQARP